MENKKLKIGIDIDDVVFEFAKSFLKFYERETGKKILYEDVFTYDFDKLFNVSLEEVMTLLSKMVGEKLTLDMPLCDFAKEIIIELSKKHKILFVTSRIVREGTLESLNKYFRNINFELVYSSNSWAGTSGKTKGEICKNLGIDFMVEDCKKHSLNCAKEGIKVFLLDKPWNKECEKHENITRVRNWKEILERLDEDGN